MAVEIFQDKEKGNANTTEGVCIVTPSLPLNQSAGIRERGTASPIFLFIISFHIVNHLCFKYF